MVRNPTQEPYNRTQTSLKGEKKAVGGNALLACLSTVSCVGSVQLLDTLWIELHSLRTQKPRAPQVLGRVLERSDTVAAVLEAARTGCSREELPEVRFGPVGHPRMLGHGGPVMEDALAHWTLENDLAIWIML